MGPSGPRACRLLSRCLQSEKAATPNCCCSQGTWKMKWLLTALLMICAAGDAAAQVYLRPGNDIQSAINANAPGTTFYLAAGVYRGQNLSPKNGDQFYGVSGQTFLNGAVVLSSWSRSGGYWVTRTGIPTPLPFNTSIAPLPCCPLAQHRNDLFINNQLYARAPSLAALGSGTWYFDEANLIAYLSDDPTGKTVELSVTPRAFTGHSQPAYGGSNVTLQDIIVEKYASDSSDAAIAGGYGWVLNNVTARWNHGAGAAIGAYARIEGGSYSYNGEEGIFLFDASNAVVHWAEIAGNNYAGYNYGSEGGGLKGGTTSGNPSSSGMQIINNYVHDNNGHGIHMDSDNSYYTISGNTVYNNVYAGIQDECNYAPSIHDNLLGYNGTGGTDYYQWGQITVNDTQGAQIYNNVMTVGSNVGNGITMIGIARGVSPIFGTYRLLNNTIQNNTIYYSANSGTSGMVFWDYPDDGSNKWDYNTYYMPDTSQPHWYFGSWVQYTWSRVQSLTGQERHGQALAGR